MNTLIENYSIWEIIQSIKENRTKIIDWKNILGQNEYKLLINSFKPKTNETNYWQ